MKEKTGTVDAAEVERFSRLAGEWWNPEGKFRPLHRMNPVRLSYIRDWSARHFSLAPEARILTPLRLLDIGCGGGLVCEPLARLGAQVTGIDASGKNIAVAKLHAQQSGLTVDYRCTTAEALVAEDAQFDVVLALEIIEHVADVAAFATACAALVKPGGLLFFSTLNRTAKAYALAILGAEYVLRLLPVGTHDWKKFLRPSELCTELRHNGIEVLEMTGMVMHPLSGEWRLDRRDLSVNYMVVGVK